VNETPLCLNCRSDESDFFLQARDIFGNQHTYLKCLKCGLVYIWPLHGETKTESIYGSDYYGEDEEEKFRNGLIIKAIDYFSKQRAKRLANHLP
jgi:hypothetical protein